MSRPRVSVFMPVHNRAELVSTAAESILRQTYSDLELVIVDDGSSDATPDVLAGLTDPRVRVERNAENLGVPATRNLGFELARGELFAMMDSDDVADPRRLEKQVRFLDAHPDHAVVGSWAWRLTSDGQRGKILRRPLTWQRIRARLLFEGTLRTPSTLGRLDVLRRYPFRREFPVCSDSDFWVRVASDHRCANLPEPLIDYRIHSSSITKSRVAQARERKIAIMAAQLERLGVEHDAQDLACHYVLRKPGKDPVSPQCAEWARGWLPRLLEANRARALYPEPHFTHAVGERWYRLWRLDGRRGRTAGLRLLDPAVRTATLAFLLRHLPLRLRYGSFYV